MTEINKTPAPLQDQHPEWLNTWRAARARWMELADLPHNGNWDDPRSVECRRVQYEMERQLSTVPPTTIAGAIACLSWIDEEMNP